MRITVDFGASDFSEAEYPTPSFGLTIERYQMMRFWSIALSVVLACLPAGGALAEGGKVQDQNPIFGDDCVEMTPPGIDLDQCEQMPAPPQSGVEVFFCEGATRIIVCESQEEG